MSIYANQNDALSSEIQTTTESVELLTSAIIEAEEPINTTPAYVYRLFCKPTGQFYYGFRYANIKKYRMPADDLWIYYFASSDSVDALVEMYGKSSFEYKVIFQSTDIHQTYLFEQTIIKAYWGNPMLLNLQYKDPVTGGKMWAVTKESREKAVETGRARGSYEKSARKRKESGSAKLAAKKATATKKKLGIDKIAGQKMVETKRIRGTAKSGSKKAVETKNKNGMHKIGAQRAADTRKRTGTGKIAAIKTALIRRKNGTHVTGALKAAATKKKNGIDKIATEKALATKKRTGVMKEAGKKSSATKLANGGSSAAGKKGYQTRLRNGTQPSRSRDWRITSPEGEVILVKNLKQFCRDHGINYEGIRKTLSIGKEYNGWSGTKLN